MPAPAVSVIVPTHNRRALLRQALDSIASQTFQDFETFVVDDGSDEPIGPTISDHPARPVILRQSRGGPAAARNLGVARSSANWIAFLDSDDEWLPTKLERFLAEARNRPEVSLWYGPMLPMDVAGRHVRGRTKLCHSGRITRSLFESSFVHVPTVVCRRDVFLSFGGFDESLPVCEDYDLWLRMSLTQEFGLVSEPLAKRRLHPDRLSKVDMGRNLSVKVDVLERFARDPAARDALDPRTASLRLARVSLAAARAALRARRSSTARRMAMRAVTHGAPGLHVWPVSTAARLLQWFKLDRADDMGSSQRTSTILLQSAATALADRRPSRGGAASSQARL